NRIRKSAFIQPLRAIGLKYGDDEDSAIFVKCDDVICSLGVLGTPALLMQSGIGPKNVLNALGIPVLLDQPNVGKYVSNHYGAMIRWTGDRDIWGGLELGTENSNGYLPGLDHEKRRKFQYYSNYTPETATQPEMWSMNLYDLDPKSTGTVEATQSWDT